MKQGRTPEVESGHKREPIPHAIDPGAVSQMGNMVVQNPDPLHKGRGYSAPSPVAETTHHCGSQGRHK